MSLICSGDLKSALPIFPRVSLRFSIQRRGSNRRRIECRARIKQSDHENKAAHNSSRSLFTLHFIFQDSKSRRVLSVDRSINRQAILTDNSRALSSHSYLLSEIIIINIPPARTVIARFYTARKANLLCGTSGDPIDELSARIGHEADSCALMK